MILGSLLLGVVVYSLWFIGAGPFAASSRTSQRRAVPEDAPTPFPAGAANGPASRYPSLDDDPEDRAAAATQPDFAPPLHAPGGPTASHSLLHLARLLPGGTSVLAMIRLDALRAQAWAQDVIMGRKLPSLRARLAPLGLDLREDTRAVLGIDLEARPAPPPAEGQDLRFLGKRDRPFVLLLESPTDRKELLQRFRRFGPLAATEILGRRVYRRAGNYAMTFPLRGSVAFAYRRPMGPLLANLLEIPSGSALSKQTWRALEEAGLIRMPAPPGQPPTVGDDMAPTEPRAASIPRPAQAPPAAQRPASPTPVRASHPDATVPGPRHTEPGTKAATVTEQDSKLPWVTLVWTARAGIQPPYPLKQISGYGHKASLRSALVTLGPGPAGGARLELRLFYDSPSSPPQMAALLRYAKRHIARWPRVKRAQLSELVSTVPINVSGERIHVILELQAWHLRALKLLFHKLLEAQP